MKKNNITIHDIAKMLGISSSTVSRALNNNPRISKPTREAVNNLAKQEGYQPNSMASSLRIGKNKTVGLIIPHINRHFFSNVIGGIEEVLNYAGYNLMICQSDDSLEKEIQNIKTLMNLRVEGIFISLALGSINTDHLRNCLNKGVKLMMFDRVDENLSVDCVVLNDYEGAYMSVKHLIEQGYRKIVHFSGPDHINVYHNRKQGYIDAVKHSGLEIPENYILQDVLTREKGYAACTSLLQSNQVPDAIFAASDFSALGAMIALKEKGLSVPYDIGVAGFANEPFTALMEPALTSVDQNSIEMGRILARLFLEKDSAVEISTQPQTLTLTPKLLIRKSTLRNSE